MDIENINAFTKVLVSTLETTCNKKPIRWFEFQKVTGDVTIFDGLLCYFSFSGGLNGIIVMALSEQVACKLYGGMMMEEVEELDEEVAEGFTEIANMIIGNVKADLGKHKLTFTSPEIRIGKGDAPAVAKDLEWLLIPMAFQQWGDFRFFLNLEE